MQFNERKITSRMVLSSNEMSYRQNATALLSRKEIPIHRVVSLKGCS